MVESRLGPRAGDRPTLRARRAGKAWLLLGRRSCVAKSELIAASHCLHNDGQFITSAAFIPGANGTNDQPYGVWPIRTVRTTDTWAANSNCETSCPWGSDYGVAVADTTNGSTLQSRVGALGILVQQEQPSTVELRRYFWVSGRSTFQFWFSVLLRRPSGFGALRRLWQIRLAQDVRHERRLVRWAMGAQ